MATEKIAYEVFFNFGKHKDKSLGFVMDSDPSYIAWMANNQTMPALWRNAAQRLLKNETLDGLPLPRQTYKKSDLDITMWVKDAKTINVSFAYDRELLERFKFEIDGRKWNNNDKHWEVPAPQILKMIDLFGGTNNIKADEKVKQLYREEKERRKTLDEIRIKEDSDDSVKDKLNQVLKYPAYNFQNVAIEFVERAGGRAMIADQQGLGKTVSAIGYAMYKGSKTLVVCPKSVVIQWSKEIERFTGKKATIWYSDGKSGRIDAQWHIIHYDIVEKRAPELRQAQFDLLVCDEATYIKNRKTKRAKAILGDFKQRRIYPGLKTKQVIFLTGTPVLNKPIEAFVLLNFLDSSRFNNFYQFTQKYGGWKGDSPRNLADLHERTKDLVIRRLKKQVWPEMPPKQRNNLYVELTPDEMVEYNELLNKLFRKWRTLGKPTIAEMPAIQNYLIKKKLPRLCEVIDEMIEQDRGVLIFSCYVDPLIQLAKKYKGQSALIHGQMTTTERQKSIDDLKSGKAKVGAFSIGAGAMGIDGLQHSIDTVIFLDRWWVPSIHEQAEDRIYRGGQTKQVSVYYMTCADTIDEYMGDLLKEKQEMIDKLVDGQILNFDPNKSIFNDFVKKLRAGFDLQEIKFEGDADLPQLP